MLLLLSIHFWGNGQSNPGKESSEDRKPCVAGRFYPLNPSELKNELAGFFAKAKPKTKGNVVAIVTPHAGYVYSGQVAASAFNQIDADKKYERIFIIGSSHRAHFEGASVYNIGNYASPLGTVKVDLRLAKKLTAENKVFTFNKDADLYEHSLEVQLPFLQYKMKSDFKIVPIILGTQSKSTIAKISETLKPYFNDKNLFVISSDFSHYPPYKSAVEVDKATADAIVLNSPEAFLEILGKNDEKQIPNLQTSICGWTSMLTVLNITKDLPGIRIIPVEYKNSGDVPIGDKSQVVGYWAIAITQNDDSEIGFNLSDDDKKNLLHIARSTLEKYINQGIVPEIDATSFSETLKTAAGAFVTLHQDGELRGCIGTFTPSKPLYLVVQEMAVSASTKDYRFSRVTSSEIGKIEIEISVLTPMKKINSISEIILGKHGIYIKKGMYGGTFLPQVATETGWNLEEFLGHCSRDKAGIGWEGWKDAEISVYEALVFEESQFE
jgi:hypothetical protein